MAKSKKTGKGAKLKIINESRQRQDFLLKPKKEGDLSKVVRLSRGKTATISANEVSEQLQAMLDNYEAHGLRIVGGQNEGADSSDDGDKEEPE